MAGLLAGTANLVQRSSAPTQVLDFALVLVEHAGREGDSPDGWWTRGRPWRIAPGLLVVRCSAAASSCRGEDARGGRGGCGRRTGVRVLEQGAVIRVPLSVPFPVSFTVPVPIRHVQLLGRAPEAQLMLVRVAPPRRRLLLLLVVEVVSVGNGLLQLVLRNGTVFTASEIVIIYSIGTILYFLFTRLFSEPTN